MSEVTSGWLDGIVASNRAKVVVNGDEQPDNPEVEFSGSVSVSTSESRTTMHFTGGGNTTASYVVANEELGLPNSCVIDGTSSVFVEKSSGAIAVSCIFGNTEGTCCEGSDARLSNARTPTSHSSTHKHGGGDEIATATAAANAIPKAGSGGQLDAAWIPTGTTSGKIPVLDSSGQLAATAVPNARWYKAPGTLSNTSSDGSSVTITGSTIRLYQPIKVLDMAGVITAGNAPTITVVTGITGLQMTHLDWLGKLYFKSVVVSDPTYRFDIYSDVVCTKLVGHTSNFNASITGDYVLTVTAENGSGLGGTITAHAMFEARSAGIVHNVRFAQVGYIDDYDSASGYVSIAGPTLSTSTGYIREVWLGAHGLTSIFGLIPGRYEGTTTSQAVVDRTGFDFHWPYGAAQLVKFGCKNITADTGATQAKVVPVIGGTPLLADSSVPQLSTAWCYTAFPSTIIDYGVVVDLRVIKGTNGDALNLNYEFIAVEL